jgi:hypothetical protein
LHSAASSAATKFAALEGLPPDEDPVLDLLGGVLSWCVPGDEPLFFSLLLMMCATAMTMGQQRRGDQQRGNGNTNCNGTLFKKVSECQMEVRVNE